MTMQSRQASGKQAMIQSANQAVGAGVAGGAASWYLTNADMESIHDDAEIAIGFNAVSSLITLTSGEVSKMLPDSDTPYHARVWEPSDRTNYEIVLVTDVTGDVLTVLRGREGTTAQTWTSAALIRVRNDVTVNYKVGITTSDGAVSVSPQEILFCLEDLTIVHEYNNYAGSPSVKSRITAYDTTDGSIEWQYIASTNYSPSSFYPVAKPSASYFAVGGIAAIYIHSLSDGSLVRTITPYYEGGLSGRQVATEIVEGADKVFTCVLVHDAGDAGDGNRVFIAETTISTGAQSEYEIVLPNAFDATKATPRFGLATYFNETAVVVNKTFHEVFTSGYTNAGVNPFSWWPYPTITGQPWISSVGYIQTAQVATHNPTGQNDTDFFFVGFEWDGDYIEYDGGYPALGTFQIVKCSKADFSVSAIYEDGESVSSSSSVRYSPQSIKHCNNFGLVCRENSPATGVFYTVGGDRTFSPYVARVDGSGDYSTRLIPSADFVAAPDGDTISFITPDYDYVRNYVQEQNA